VADSIYYRTDVVILTEESEKVVGVVVVRCISATMLCQKISTRFKIGENGTEFQRGVVKKQISRGPYFGIVDQQVAELVVDFGRMHQYYDY
jgi:hypothetical protein